MIHNAQRRCHDNVTELTRREQVVGPLFNRSQSQIETGRNHSALVEPSNELDNNLPAAMIIDNLELTNVAYSPKRQEDQG